MKSWRTTRPGCARWVRSRAKDYGIDEEFFNKADIHLHIPAGATPKDGPSAGVTMATALMRLLTGRPVRKDVAMTGEITLRGQVLPVGGIKEKVLAANRYGLTTVILPKRNEFDLDEVPENVRANMKFIFAERVDEVVQVALTPSRTNGHEGAAEMQSADETPDRALISEENNGQQQE